MSAPVLTRERPTLSRDLADFVVAFSGAFQRYAMYPDGHPALDTAVRSLAKRLEILFLDRPSVSVGVTPTQLVICGTPTDPEHPLLRDLAGQLHGFGIGGIKVYRGVQRSELNGMLRLVVRDRDVESASNHSPRWSNIRLYPLTYDHLEMLEEDDDPEPVEAGELWARRVWLGLARAALGEHLPEQLLATADPLEIAVAVDARGEDPEFDRKIMTSLTELTQACRNRGRAESLAVQRHLARLVATLPKDTLERLMAMGGDELQRHDFLLDVSHVMSAETVLRLVETAAHAARRSLSPGLLQLLTKLAAHAERGPAARRAWADQALREQIRQVVEGWRQKDGPTTLPELYENTLDRLPRVASEDFEPVQVYASDPERIIQMSLEGGIVEPGTLRAADRMVARRQIARLIDLIETVPAVDPAAQELRARVFHPYTVSVLLTVAPVDLETLNRLIPQAGLDAAGPMMDALAAAKERRVRARLLDLLARFGTAIGAEVTARIPGAPWYVQRNMLKLLSMLPALPPDFSVELCLGHDDPRVRHEGLKLLLRDPRTREAALLDSLQAPDIPTVRLGLVAALEGCPASAARIIIEQLEAGNLSTDLKAMAARAIAPISDPAVLHCLRRLALGRRILWRRRLAPKSPEMLAALTGLSIHWRNEARVVPILDMAARQPDREIRDAVWTPPALRPGAPPPRVLMP